jgi:hypothetical protein
VKLTVDDVLVLTTKTQQAQAAIEQWMEVPQAADQPRERAAGLAR